MPVLTQLNLNVGTEQNPNMVLHDLHDIRISSTDVNTVTRLLGCDAGVNSIAPLTLASAASLLGVKDLSSLFTVPANGYQTGLDANNILSGLFAYSTGGSNFPENWGLIFAFGMVGRIVFQLFVGASRKAYIRIYAENVGWSTWKEL